MRGVVVRDVCCQHLEPTSPGREGREAGHSAAQRAAGGGAGLGACGRSRPVQAAVSAAKRPLVGNKMDSELLLCPGPGGDVGRQTALAEARGPGGKQSQGCCVHTAPMYAPRAAGMMSHVQHPHCPVLTGARRQAAKRSPGSTFNDASPPHPPGSLLPCSQIAALITSL